MFSHSSRVDWAGWFWRCVGAVIFIAVGFDKFGAAPGNGWIAIFARIGLGQWFRIATGSVEIVGGCLLLLPMTVRFGAVLLGATMVGAIIAHLTRLGDPVAVIIPGALLAFLVFLALREPEVPLAELTRTSRRG